MTSHKIRLSFLADQFGSGVGGGRFTRDFLRALLSDATALEQLERVFILATEGEPTDSLEPLPSNVIRVQRRFPSRLRTSFLAGWWGRACPQADVAHGPFYYVFPHQARSQLITLHDLSFLDERFHMPAKRRMQIARIQQVLPRCQAIVCDSDSVLSELRSRWPHLHSRCTRIYPGVFDLSRSAKEGDLASLGIARPFILAVGTIEPRKNYDRMLDAFEYLLAEQGDSAPDLVIVGRKGWMCEVTVARLTRLASSGKLHWFSDANDAQLALLYQRAKLFIYLSIYEGFGYPPFEATYAQVPMVLSKLSTVGELWLDYACCIDPTSIKEIIDAWKWVWNLDETARKALLAKQRARLADFTWQRCIHDYLDLYQHLARNRPSRSA